MTSTILSILTEVWQITAEMAPFLLLGFAVAGLLSVYISPAWLQRHLGGRGLTPAVKASLFGIPLPLCSCGVIPVGASLRRQGAGRSATTAFLLSTPQTGVDSILVTWTMLGPFFAVFRPLAALLTGLMGGAAVQALDPDPHHLAHGDHKAQQRPRGWRKLTAAWRYGFVTLPGDIWRALLVGLLIAGALGAVIPADALGGVLGRGPLAILLMMIVGIPIYVCATASVPVAASFIHLGASPGAALAFLIAGPATNAATLTTIARVLGRKTAAIFLTTVAVSAFGGGLLLDWLLPQASLAIPYLGMPAKHHHGIAWWGHLSAVVLAVVLAGSWWAGRSRRCDDGTCGLDAGSDPGSGSRPVQSRIFKVDGMNCSHCAASVEQAVTALDGVESCRVDLATGSAVVTGSEVALTEVAAAVAAVGYRAEPKEGAPQG